jgi:hypothetical protein
VTWEDGVPLQVNEISSSHLQRVRGYSVAMVIGLIAKWRGMEAAEYCSREWITPRFHNTDEHKVYVLRWLEEYLTTRDPVRELSKLMQRLNLSHWAFKSQDTLENPSRLSQQKHKIMMRYSAVFRTAIYIDDFKIEEGEASFISVPQILTKSRLGSFEKAFKGGSREELVDTPLGLAGGGWAISRNIVLSKALGQ